MNTARQIQTKSLIIFLNVLMLLALISGLLMHTATNKHGAVSSLLAGGFTTEGYMVRSKAG